MNTIMANRITYELIEMGFKGAQIQQLLEVITNDDHLQDFRNFILLKGEGMTKVQKTHKFRKHMQDKQSFSDADSFEKAYNDSKTVQEKEEALVKLFGMESARQVVYRVSGLLMSNDHNLSIRDLYNFVAPRRSHYTPSEIIVLLMS